MLLKTAFLVALALGSAFAYLDNGVRVHRFWPPLANAPSTGNQVWTINPCTFNFEDVTGAGPDSDIDTAIGIYQSVIFPTKSCASDAFLKAAPTLTGLNITAVAPHSQIPQLGVDESYTIEIPDPSGSVTVAVLKANTYVGVLRGLETFSQLVLYSALNSTSGVVGYNIPEAPWSVSDAPSFPHRGLLVDPARTYIPIPLLQRVIDGLMYSKMNVLHIHISDSQSFPLQLDLHPEITLNGAMSADQTYTRADLSNLIEYASARGVRVIPEIDTPGHARSFGLAPTLTEIVACANQKDWTKACAEPPCGQLNPASALMYQVLQNVLEEVATLFPETFMHVGYDEINFNCWLSEPSIQAYLKTNNITVNEMLLEFYNKQRTILDTVASGKRVVFWEESALQNPPLPHRDSDVIQVWSSQDNLKNILANTTSQIIISWYENVYLDCGQGNMFGDDSWCDPYKSFLSIYMNDPLAGFAPSDRPRALGGEAALWGETVSPTTLEARAWPRTSSYGGRLWAYDNVQTKENVGLNVQAHSARLQQRGLASSAVILPFCALYPDYCYSSSDNKAD